MIWLKTRDLDKLMDIFDRATEGGDPLVAGEIFDTLLQITVSGQEHAKDKGLEGMQWKRMAEECKGRIEGILKNPMLRLESQLILGRKCLVLIDEDILKDAAKAPIIPSSDS